MADDQAFLSARVPVEIRNRFKALAAGKGLNVQDLLREIVGDYVRAQTPPEAALVIQAVRQHRPELEAMGLVRLSLVGSVARGEARVGSDIDFAFAFGERPKISLLDYVELKHQLEGWLPGYEVDVSPWKSLRPSVEKEMVRDAIEIL